MGCDIQFANEGEADLFGFLLEKEFYAMDYPKWKGEGFFEFLMRRHVGFGIRMLDFQKVLEIFC